ncbi:MAG: hypothetical protein QN210_12280 [Armatimonadota bacterium]|nr:hypothetical protein [Armatimonadota bacterium]
MRALSDVALFAQTILGRPLRPYQLAAARAVLESVRHRRGLTVTVLFARQMGKNELSAVLECYLMTAHQLAGGQIVKAAPTFRPQIVTSMQRLERLLENPLTRGQWRREHGYMLRLGRARTIFFSAEPQANVVGATADLLLEIDEAQDVDPEKYARDFRPMGATANVTTVLYGTAWTGDTLLARQAALNQAAERADGVRRHFQFDWTHGAAANPLYGRYVAQEIARLGPDHPIIRTQYRLETLDGIAGFFSPEQQALLRGAHARCRQPVPGAVYVAGVDVAGAAEQAADAALRALKPRKDSTVCGIAELARTADGLPVCRLVEIYWWTGRPLDQQAAALIHLLRAVWQVRRVAVDASGIGADLAARLSRALGPQACEPVVFTAPEKSRLGYELLALVNRAGLQAWAEDHSPESRALWAEVARCRYELRAREQIAWYVPEDEGHDDFVTMLALVARAAQAAPPPPAAVRLPPGPGAHDEGRY